MEDYLPVVYMPETVFEKWFTYIDIAKGEISGLGHIEEVEGVHYVRNLYLIKQTATDILTTFDPLGHSAFVREMVGKGIPLSAFRLWWHSHGVFQVGWSRDKDDETIKRMSQKYPLFSIVGNKEGHFATRYDIQKPEPFSVFNFTIYTYTGKDEVIFTRAELEKEVAEKVVYKPSSKQEVEWENA